MGKRKPVGPVCCVHRKEVKDGESFLAFQFKLEDGTLCDDIVCGACAGAIFVLVMKKLDEGANPDSFGLSHEESHSDIINPETGKPFQKN
jgi:hypothetical protein